MTLNPLIWIGLAGVEADDNPRALHWQQRLHAFMIGIALLALPAYVLDSTDARPIFHHLAWVLDGVIFFAFLLETVWMVHVTSHPARYLLENWLNLLILVGAGASALGAATEWIAILRVARIAVGSLVLVRALSEFRVLFTRRGAPRLVGAACLFLIASGGVLFWLEPTIPNYWDGLWLAFVTGTTIGYGDIVPTTAPARIFAVVVAVVGVALMTLFTANIVAFFIGRDSGPSREEMRDAVRDGLAGDAAETRAQWNALQQEVQGLRAEIAALRADLARPEAPAPAGPPTGPLDPRA